MVKMYHDDPSITGGPVEADVPPEGLDMMRRGGWYTKDDGGLSLEELEKMPIDKMKSGDLKQYAKLMEIEFPKSVNTRSEMSMYLADYINNSQNSE